MTLAEITGWDDCSLVPCIDRGNTKPLWVTDLSGGVLRSGLLEYMGAVCGYELVEEREEKMTVLRRFALLRLSPAQIAEEFRWREDVQRRVGGGRDVAWWDELFRQRTRPDYSGCEVIGWFEC